MEKKGFTRLMDRLIDADVEITEVSTDRHPQIRKLMRIDPKHNNIKHSVDPWHLIKGMKKKLNAKVKVCEIIGNILLFAPLIQPTSSSSLSTFKSERKEREKDLFLSFLSNLNAEEKKR